ncbi:MAG: division/cell wall cluster transcriptional repressor MraZ [Dokdonella sp.]
MFQGETAITLDDKGRIAIPAAYRDVVARECANRLVITYNPFEQGSLWIFPESEWESVRDQVNGMRGVAVRQALQKLQRKLVGAAAHVELDGNARVSIPASHRSACALEKKAVLLGMGNKFELWSEAAHLATIRETISEEQLTEEMLDLRM